jgi:hypothetical protein
LIPRAAAPALWRRALVLAMLALLAGCAESPPAVFEKLDFDYLTRLRLDVGRVDIDDSWAPRGNGRQVGYLAPTRPEAALRSMGQRLLPAGTQGRAEFVIDDAAIVRQADLYVGTFAVHLDLFDAENQRNGHVEARVRGTRPVTDDEDMNAVRADLDALVRKMMSDMNVEFEFQLRKALKGRLAPTTPDAPIPPVEQQDLSLPPGAKAAPPPPADAAPAVPPPATLSPPPAMLDAPPPPPVTTP